MERKISSAFRRLCVVFVYMFIHVYFTSVVVKNNKEHIEEKNLFLSAPSGHPTPTSRLPAPAE